MGIMSNWIFPVCRYHELRHYSTHMIHDTYSHTLHIHVSCYELELIRDTILSLAARRNPSFRCFISLSHPSVWFFVVSQWKYCKYNSSSSYCHIFIYNSSKLLVIKEIFLQLDHLLEKSINLIWFFFYLTSWAWWMWSSLVRWNGNLAQRFCAFFLYVGRARDYGMKPRELLSQTVSQEHFLKPISAFSVRCF